MFTLTLLEILLSKGRSVLWPAGPAEHLEQKPESFSKKPNMHWEFVQIAWKGIELPDLEVLNNFYIFLIFFKPFSTAKIEKLNYWDANNYINFKHKQLEKHKYKVYQSNTIKKLVECSLKIVEAKAMFILTVFEIMLCKGTSVLWPAQWSTASERIQVPVKSQTNIVNYSEFLWKVINLQAYEVLNSF